MAKPDGITAIDPKLKLNSKGYYGLSANSPAINAAKSGYSTLPEYPGLDIDNKIIYDLMMQKRPEKVALKDAGCSEYLQNVSIKPIANEGNTGPSYLLGEEGRKPINKD